MNEKAWNLVKERNDKMSTSDNRNKMSIADNRSMCLDHKPSDLNPN